MRGFLPNERTLAFFGVGLCLLVVAPTLAHAQVIDAPERYLLGASQLYRALEYERALEQLKRARTVSKGVPDDAIIARYEGIILFDAGKPDEAVAAFREALYLEPDAVLPLKVSPKITATFEATRATVKKEIAPLLLKKAAEKEQARAAEAEAARAQAARDQTVVERESQLRAELEVARKKGEEAQALHLADLKRREDDAREVEGRLAETRRQIEAARSSAKNTAPPSAHLLPSAVTTPPTMVQRPTPVAPFVFGGLTLLAGGGAIAGGVLASQSLASARAAQFQDQTVGHLKQANDFALMTNIAIGVAAGAAVATIVSVLVHAASAPAPAEVTP